MTAVDALARAHRAVSHPNDPRCDHPDLHTNTARALLSNLSVADRLKVAGITEERLAAALDKHMADFLDQPESFDHSGHVAANIWSHLLAAALATPGSPEGGEP